MREIFVYFDAKSANEANNNSNNKHDKMCVWEKRGNANQRSKERQATTTKKKKKKDENTRVHTTNK